MRLIGVIAVAGFALTGCGPSRQQVAADDDATCQSYGAAPGSQAYIECRMRRDTTRMEGDNARRAAIASQPMIPMIAPR